MRYSLSPGAASTGTLAVIGGGTTIVTTDGDIWGWAAIVVGVLVWVWSFSIHDKPWWRRLFSKNKQTQPALMQPSLPGEPPESHVPPPPPSVPQANVWMTDCSFIGNGTAIIMDDSVDIQARNTAFIANGVGIRKVSSPPAPPPPEPHALPFAGDKTLHDGLVYVSSGVWPSGRNDEIVPGDIEGYSAALHEVHQLAIKKLFTVWGRRGNFETSGAHEPIRELDWERGFIDILDAMQPERSRMKRRDNNATMFVDLKISYAEFERIWPHGK